MSNPLFNKAIAISVAALLVGCTHSAIAPETENPEVPAEWTRGGDAGAVELNWLKSFNDQQLTAFVSEAIASNYQLEQERARLYQAEQTVVITRANRFPDLDVSIDASRRNFEDSSGASLTTDSFGASLDMRWQVDLWGKLSKDQQAAQLSFEAQRVRLEAVQRALAATITGATFDVMEAKQLLEVAQRRLDNAIQSRDIVASGYRQGLNDALDLYLARNQVERQVANFSQADQTYAETIADLQLALARYPDGRMQLAGELPVIDDPIPSGLPSELLTRRPDIQEAWLNLLAADADLASAHKARFPSLSLVGSGGVASAAFGDLLDGEGATWSLLGGVTQPLFNSGRLKALEEQARARVADCRAAVSCISCLRAFADVENAISRSASLKERYESFLEAEKNSRAALALALEQYQRGLVPYTTVLESQRQAFDAETQVVQLRNLRLQNRIALYISLGGEFSTVN